YEIPARFPTFVILLQVQSRDAKDHALFLNRKKSQTLEKPEHGKRVAVSALHGRNSHKPLRHDVSQDSLKTQAHGRRTFSLRSLTAIASGVRSAQNSSRLFLAARCDIIH